MDKKLKFLIIDDDETVLEEYSRLIKQGGHEAYTLTSSLQALEKINEIKPNCILCDLLLPGIDGLDLFQELRQNHANYQPTFIIITGKQYEFDHRRALKLGVDGYITKPINKKNFVDELLEIINNTVTIDFWGCRGSLSVPGKNTIIYGGNTSCVTLNIPNQQFFIFDAGTGLKTLSNYLVKHNKFPMSAKIFITHPHYDHICGIPFFQPLYIKDNQFEFYGPNQHELTLNEVIANQMDSVYFPVTIQEFSAKIFFHSLSEETFKINNIIVKTIYLNHPGMCLGYRIEVNGKSFCYITDNEIYLKEDIHYNQFEIDRLINFIKDANILVMDATYTDNVYKTKIGWGHSCISRVVDIANEAKVKLLCLHHHDPDQTDHDITLKLEEANLLLKARHSHTRCIAPHEGDRLVL